MSNIKEIGIEDLLLPDKITEKVVDAKINTIYELITTFPRRYEFFELEELESIIFDREVFIEVVIHSKPIINRYAGKKSVIKFTAIHNNKMYRIVLYNRGFYFKKLLPNTKIYLKGRFTPKTSDFYVSSLFFKLPDQKVKPIYGMKEIKDIEFSRIVRLAFVKYGKFIKDYLPEHLLKKYKLVSISDAYFYGHFPVSAKEVKEFRRRVKYSELFEFQLKIQVQANQRLTINGIVVKKNEKAITDFINGLPFKLTNDQQNANVQILNDLESKNPMNRLVQGDVGCGKTVVSAIATYATVINGQQVAFMAPTEVLAKQQIKSFKKFFEKYGFKIELLTSNVKGKKRTELLKRLSLGEIDILIGTHALITEEVKFSNLALAIIDEQQRFGVNQRKKLREKGDDINVLYLSATPIPRTLALAMFKDIDITLIKQMPKGRKPIKTYAFSHMQMKQVCNSLRREMTNGNQIFVVAPLIEESEKLDLKNATKMYEDFSLEFKGEFEIGLMHGKLGNDEKAEIMDKFIKNEMQLLVSTTVIEVGVDVPNATVMLILDAHRFGVSQLHQLRGRVGRGDKQAFCILISDEEKVANNPRIKAMLKTNDGFVLSEYDMKLRGPGDFFGVNQAGLPQFKIANIVDDYNILEIARDDVYEILSKNDENTSELVKNFNALFKILD